MWGLSIFIASPDDQSGSAFLHQTIGFLVTFIIGARREGDDLPPLQRAAQPPRVALRTLWVGMRILLAGLGSVASRFRS